MPKAVANIEETERLDLKSLPEGFVVLRRMTYGQILHRRSLTTMAVSTTGNGKQKNFEAEMAMANKKIQEFEFANCIVDHNLFADDEETVKLDFSSPVDLAKLDPRVGQEIESKISDMNNFEEADQGN